MCYQSSFTVGKKKTEVTILVVTLILVGMMVPGWLVAKDIKDK